MSETDLRWRLRQLPREMDPPHDLWPGILAGIKQAPVRSTRRWWPGLAMAASVALAAGLFWKGSSPSEPGQADALNAKVVATESKAISDEYRAALRQFDGAPMPPGIAPSLKTMDRSVVQIQRAIAADPGSVFLLEQLRKTYSRRLALTQRAATS